MSNYQLLTNDSIQIIFMTIKNFAALSVFAAVALSVAFGGFAPQVHASIGVKTGAEVDLDLGRGGSDPSEDRLARERMEDNDDHKKGGDTSDGRMYKGDDKNESRSIGITGTVTAISGSTIAVKSNRNNTTYNVVTANAKIYKGPTVKALADIKVGDFIIAEGSIEGDKFMATRILDTQFNMNYPENGNWENFKPGIMGTISAVSGTTLTVTAKDGTVYTVATADAKFQKEKGSTIGINDLKVGDTVLIQGTVNGTNVTAKNVFDAQITMNKIENKMDKMENNNGNHNGFFVRFGNFFRNIFKGKASVSVNSAISGNTYRLASFNGTLVANDQNYTATFKDGKLSAKFCNTLGGDYSLKDGTIKAQLTSTMMYCSTPSNLMTIESTFGKVTSEGGTIKIDSTNTLTLTGKSGEIFVFTKA